FFFQAEDRIRDFHVTGVQTCALPIYRVMSHDESLHTRYSYSLYADGNFQHTPLMHGPILFHVTAFFYFLFGDNDFTARLYPAIRSEERRVGSGDRVRGTAVLRCFEVT